MERRIIRLTVDDLRNIGLALLDAKKYIMKTNERLSELTSRIVNDITLFVGIGNLFEFDYLLQVLNNMDEYRSFVRLTSLIYNNIKNLAYSILNAYILTLSSPPDCLLNPYCISFDELARNTINQYMKYIDPEKVSYTFYVALTLKPIREIEHGYILVQHVKPFLSDCIVYTTNLLGMVRSYIQVAPPSTRRVEQMLSVLGIERRFAKQIEEAFRIETTSRFLNELNRFIGYSASMIDFIDRLEELVSKWDILVKTIITYLESLR